MLKKELAKLDEIKKKGEQIRKKYLKSKPKPTTITVEELDRFSDGKFSKLKSEYDEINNAINIKIHEQNCFEQERLDEFLKAFYEENRAKQSGLTGLSRSHEIRANKENGK